MTDEHSARLQEDELPPISQESSLKSRLLINPNKAGTSVIDKQVIEQTIYDASKVGRFDGPLLASYSTLAVTGLGVFQE